MTVKQILTRQMAASKITLAEAIQRFAEHENKSLEEARKEFLK